MEGELEQHRDITQYVISEVFGPGPSTSSPAVLLVEVPNEVRALISDSMQLGASGVLTSVATHYPDLDFKAACRGYASGWSDKEIHALGESLMPYACLVAEKVTLQWVMDARQSRAARRVWQEDVV